MLLFSIKKVTPLEEILDPEAFCSNRSKVSTQINSSGSKHPLSTSVPDSKHRSRSHVNVNSFRMSYPDQRYSLSFIASISMIYV